MIAIVDYQAGNLASVKKAFDHLGYESAITADPGVIARAEQNRSAGRWEFRSHNRAVGRSAGSGREARSTGRVPLLGICLGMQWMFESSREAPQLRGLGLFAGECEKFPAAVKSPHVGWNQLQVAGTSRLLRGLPQDSFVYFTHSYRAPVVEATVGKCEYGGAFSAVVERGELFGVQFHPEKSGAAGLQLLRNFCEL